MIVNKNYIVMFCCLITFGIWKCTNENHLYYKKQYIKQAFDSIETYSIYKNTYNFDSLKAVVLCGISDTTQLAYIHKKIESAIKAIDKHSYMLSQSRFEEMEQGTTTEMRTNPYPFQGKMLANNNAFISLDGFIGVDSTSADQYTDSLQCIVNQLYHQGPSGWIIDLRTNSGGWPYAMIAGLGPILGKGVKAYEIQADSSAIEYYYLKSDSDYLRLSDSTYVFNDTLPVAILIGNGTGSAGELLALAFKGNPKTILIGEPTYGVSTGLRGFFMPDSTYFAVTTSRMTDRKKEGSGGPIQPERFTNDALQAFEYAYEWIRQNQK